VRFERVLPVYRDEGDAVVTLLDADAQARFGAGKAGTSAP
jgi:hypothetical protein